MPLPSISHRSRIKDESALHLCQALGDAQKRARRNERSRSLAKRKLVHTSPRCRERMVPGIVTVSLVPGHQSDNPPDFSLDTDTAHPDVDHTGTIDYVEPGKTCSRFPIEFL